MVAAFHGFARLGGELSRVDADGRGIMVGGDKPKYGMRALRHASGYRRG